MTDPVARPRVSEGRWAAAVLLGVAVSFSVYVAAILVLHVSPIASLVIGFGIGIALAGRAAKAQSVRQWVTIGIVTAVASFVTTGAIVFLMVSWAFR